MLQPSVERVLIDMGFINRYREISDKFSIKDESFKYEKSDVVNLLQELGVEVSVYEGGQYFANFEFVGNYQFRLGLTIKYNIIEVDLTVKNENLSIKSGGSLGLLVQLITDWRDSVKKPSFGNSEQLKSLLAEVVALYTDIKEEITGVRT